jgi:hypothetical protein
MLIPKRGDGSPTLVGCGVGGGWGGANKEGAADRGIIFEFKTVDKKQKQTFESVIEKAKAQIIEKNYAQELLAQGVTEIVNIIAVFEGKEVRVEHF